MPARPGDSYRAARDQRPPKLRARHRPCARRKRPERLPFRLIPRAGGGSDKKPLVKWRTSPPPTRRRSVHGGVSGRAPYPGWYLPERLVVVDVDDPAAFAPPGWTFPDAPTRARRRVGLNGSTSPTATRPADGQGGAESTPGSAARGHRSVLDDAFAGDPPPAPNGSTAEKRRSGWRRAGREVGRRRADDEAEAAPEVRRPPAARSGPMPTTSRPRPRSPRRRAHLRQRPEAAVDRRRISSRSRRTSGRGLPRVPEPYESAMVHVPKDVPTDPASLPRSPDPGDVGRRARVTAPAASRPVGAGRSERPLRHRGDREGPFHLPGHGRPHAIRDDDLIVDTRITRPSGGFGSTSAGPTSRGLPVAPHTAAWHGPRGDISSTRTS